MDAATWMAEKTGIPRLIIGATVVSLAATLPEMLVSFTAAGSVTVNTGLIMGIALICMPAAAMRRDYLAKSLLMLGAAGVLAAFGLTGQIGLVPSLLLVAIFAIAKKQCSLSVGNIIGANIIDLTRILPISSLIAGKALPVAPQFAMVDLPACLAAGCMVVVPMLVSQKFRRSQGIAMVLFYVAYLLFTTLFLG